MEGGESPLDVLSRAATMVQENQALNDDSKNSKQTTKWKRDRRSRLPEYSRKSDPKFPETMGLDQRPPSPPEYKPDVNQLQENGKSGGADTPIDMSLRQRGLPPSYQQTINNPGYRSSYRRSVIHNGGPPREELPSGISMCDPIIDEHFRRSLGNDYHTLFSNNNLAKEPPRTVSPPAATPELSDSPALSVDDHFAKALGGDTWAKLSKKPEMKSSNENSLLST
ncbi:uncharacterized protein LOC109598765 [Aethina tumida]|uniref:uncharacterized protein LOC109598765 n=1 Tax=Aethina tumida TaxID=116153 RepID=UPI002147791B|nr:uncharacterized protein LOC109598765 [Aethina tumida]